MARVTYGALITELAGSIGGITFHKNSSGNIARLKPNMPMLPSQLQGNQQYKLSSLIAIWPTLTLVQKTSWNNMAAAHVHVDKYGKTKFLNGFQWFMSCNLFRLTMSLSVLLTSPAWYLPPAPHVFSLITNPTYLKIDFGVVVTTYSDYLIVYLSTPLRQSSVKLRKSTFLIYCNNYFNSRYLDITAAFESLSGVVWSDFFSSANATLLCNILLCDRDSGITSPFTSGLIKIG
jgi:hypothetical protein